MSLPLLSGVTLDTALTNLVRRRPRTMAVFPHTSERISAADVDSMATAAAHALLAAGVNRGDVVGVLQAPTPRLLGSLFGLWRTGAAASVLPVQAGFGDDLAAARRLVPIARSAGMRHLLLGSQLRGIGAALRDLMPELSIVDPTGGTDAGAHRLPTVEPDDLAVVQFTSGSTSEPRGVMLTHRIILAGLTAVVRSGGLTPADTIVQWVPIFHDMGLIGLLSAWLNGSDVHVFTPTAFLRRPLAVLQHFAAVRGTILSGPNFAYDYLMDALRPDDLAALDLSSWRLAFNGSEPVSATTVDRFAATFGEHGVAESVMYPVYGMAEATLAVAFPTPGDPPRAISVDRTDLATTGTVRLCPVGPAAKRVMSVGRAVYGVDLRIVSPAGVGVGPGTLGEIQLAGRSVTTGYLRDPAATLRLFDGSWLRTGDLGFRLDGELYVSGRLKEMVVVRGQNYFPDDVERVARDAPGVYRRRCVAFSDTDADGTEYVGVIVESSAGTADNAALRREVARRVSAELGLSGVRVHVVRPRWLTRTTSGKWQRRLALQRLSDGAADTGR